MINPMVKNQTLPTGFVRAFIATAGRAPGRKTGVGIRSAKASSGPNKRSILRFAAKPWVFGAIVFLLCALIGKMAADLAAHDFSPARLYDGTTIPNK